MKETFFLQIPPGLEDLAQKELELKFPGLAPQQQLPTCLKERGGISLELPLTTGLQLNYWLKIPNRILLRFAHFKCRDIPKFYNKVSKLNWAPFYAGQDLTFHISSHKSRLFDDRKISKALQDGLDNFLKRQEPKDKAKRRVKATKEWHLFCRFEEDWCTLSIDTSGQRLGLRGYKADIGKAPLRENLAAALFLFTSLSEKEGPYHPQKNKALTLVDPFCGSGTILLETALFYEPNLFRNYAFEFFPSWEMKKSPLKELRRPSGLNLDLPYFLVGSDIEEARIETIEKNFKAAGVIGEEEDHYFHQGDILDKDFCQRMAKNIFGTPKNDKTMVHAWCLTNPPYGDRIAQPLNGPQLLENLNNWGPWERVGILLPKDQSLPQSFGDFKQHSKLYFENGGLEVAFTLYERLTRD